MSERPPIDVGQLMERIREGIKQRKAVDDSSVSETQAVAFDDGQTAADFVVLHSGYDIQNVSFVSGRPVLGPFVVAVKRALRKLLTPILERQVAYNAATARVTARLKESVEALERRQVQAGQAIKTRVESIEAGEVSIRAAHDQLHERLSRIECQVQQELAAIESRLQELLAARSCNAMPVQEESGIHHTKREERVEGSTENAT